MFALMMSTSAFSPTLLLIGFIVVLPFLLLNAEQIRRARWVLALLAVLLVPVTMRAFLIATACDDWDWLVSEFGYAAAWAYWAIYC